MPKKSNLHKTPKPWVWPANLENSAVATGLENSVFIWIPKKGISKECSNHCTIALCRERARERGSPEPRLGVHFTALARRAWPRAGHGAAGEWRAARGRQPAAAPLSADRPEASVRPAGPRSAPWEGCGVESGEGRQRPRRAGARRLAFLQLQGAPSPFLTLMYPGFPVSNPQACLNTFPPVHSV